MMDNQGQVVILMNVYEILLELILIYFVTDLMESIGWSWVSYVGFILNRTEWFWRILSLKADFELTSFLTNALN